MNSIPFSLRPKSSYLTLLNRIVYRLKIGIFESKRKFPSFLPFFLISLRRFFFSTANRENYPHLPPYWLERDFYGTKYNVYWRIWLITVYDSHDLHSLFLSLSYSSQNIDEDNNIMFPERYLPFTDIFVFTFLSFSTKRSKRTRSNVGTCMDT